MSSTEVYKTAKEYTTWLNEVTYQTRNEEKFQEIRSFCLSHRDNPRYEPTVRKIWKLLNDQGKEFTRLYQAEQRRYFVRNRLTAFLLVHYYHFKYQFKKEQQQRDLEEYEKRFEIPRRSKANPSFDLRPEHEKEAFARWLEENTPTKITYTKAEAKAFWDQYGPDWESEYFPRQQTPPSPSPQ